MPSIKMADSQSELRFYHPKINSFGHLTLWLLVSSIGIGRYSMMRKPDLFSVE